MPIESLQHRIRDLCIKLLNGTRDQRIRWEETADENTFRLTLDSGMFHIQQVPRRSIPVGQDQGMVFMGGEKYKATLFNPNNTPVETYEEDTDSGGLLRDLYEEARRSALRPEEVMDRFERELVQRIEGASPR
jgi:hypothetical protein